MIRTMNRETHFPLIYPRSKEYVLGVICAVNHENESRLYYFLYFPRDKKIFQWTIPKPRSVQRYIGETIVEDISPLTSSGIGFELLDPSKTFDDENFWNEYVFKKEEGKYLYLNPIEVINPQPDIYTQW